MLAVCHRPPGYSNVLVVLHGSLALLVGITSGVGLVLGGMLDQNKASAATHQAA